MHNFSLGQDGESKAAAYLASLNYQILDQNVRLKHQEIDLIALDQETDELVFVEVKTRGSSFFGNPSQAVNKIKLRSMQYVAGAYRRARGFRNDYRFDIISILPGKIEHFKNITWNWR